VSYDDKDYIRFQDHYGCYSNIGRIGGKQTISLDTSGCMTERTVMHEVIHALGYNHMQNHAQRDNYVGIYWNNIQSGHEHNFQKVGSNQNLDFGLPYDYYSIMHYSWTAFAINPNFATVYPLDPKYNRIIGKVQQLSVGDVRRINRMYGCKNEKYT
jgi:hypothetical protein